MIHPRFPLGILLLAGLLTADVPASADDLVTIAGEVEVDVSRIRLALPLYGPAVAEQICDVLDDPPETSSLGQCRLKIGSSALGKQAIEGRAEILPLAPDQSQEVPWYATRLDLGSIEPVETSCGTVEVSLSLAPDVAQPASRIVLQTTGYEGERGVFSGAVKLKARLHLTHVATGMIHDIPLPIRFLVAGSFRLASRAKALDATTRLTLLAEWLLGSSTCLPAVMFEGPEGEKLWKDLLAAGCPICGMNEYADSEVEQDLGHPFEFFP